MGTEGDQLIFSYLSKVGDLAQAAMPPRDRARLVAKLRDDIDRQRGGSDSPAAVRRILGRLGSPDEVVSAASAVPAQREPEAPRPELVREPEAPGRAPVVPRQADAPGGGDPAPGEAIPGASPGAGPKSAGSLGPSSGLGGGEPWPVRLDKGEAGAPEPVGLDGPPPVEWWRTPRRPLTLEEIAALPGVTIPLDAPAEAGTGEEAVDGEAAAKPDADATAGEPQDGPPPSRKGRWRLGGRARGSAADGKPEPEPRGGRRGGLPGLGGLRGLGGAFMETLAAVALFAGAVLGSWLPLLAGWAMAYYSRRLSPSEAKFAALGLPGTVLVGMMVWLWGRTEGRWGEPIAQGRLNAAVSDAFPWTVRVAAVGSALFILWRVRRRAG